MTVTLINPPEKLRVWAGISESMAYGVYCFPPLGLCIFKRLWHTRIDVIYDAVVVLSHDDFDKGWPTMILISSRYHLHSFPSDVQQVINNVNDNPKPSLSWADTSNHVPRICDVFQT